MVTWPCKGREGKWMGGWRVTGVRGAKEHQGIKRKLAP